jgi:hypothetical protein
MRGHVAATGNDPIVARISQRRDRTCDGKLSDAEHAQHCGQVDIKGRKNAKRAAKIMPRSLYIIESVVIAEVANQYEANGDRPQSVERQDTSLHRRVLSA